MSVLDLMALLISLVGFYLGFRRGFIMAFFGMIGLLLGLILAMKFASWLSPAVASLDFFPSAWIPMISFVLMFIAAVLIIRAIRQAVESLASALMMGGINRILGGLVYAVMGIFIWSTLLWLGHRLYLFSPDLLAETRTFPYLVSLPSLVFEKFGQYWPFVETMLEDLHEYFDQISQKLPEHVGFHR